MRMMRAALLLGAAFLPLPAMAATIAPAPPAPVEVKPIDFTTRTLANGLRVYAIHDPSTANVSVQVWYDVGGKDDPKGRSGFAHMFEHLMFKGTRNMPSEAMDRLTEDVGGFNNASTNPDYTNYFEVIPANHLQRLLFAEADRMRNLVVDQPSFDSERDVVKEELRSRVFAAPYGKLFYLYLPEISYSTSPYGRPVIGSIDDLDAATLSDLRAFHATYYRPDNAILVVSGNFDPDQLNQWVDQYFGPIEKPDRPIPHADTSDAARTKAAHYTVYADNVPLPAVMLSYPVPADNDPDMPAISVLNAILSSGDSSRLHQSLVYSQQIAQTAQSDLDTKQGPGALAVFAILAAGKSADAGEAALREQIAKLRDAPVSQAELSEAKNEIVTSAIRGRETADGKASTLAQAVIIDGDPRAADKQLAAIQKVTAADVQRVARNYLAEDRSAAIRYLPASQKPAGATSDTIDVPKGTRVKPLEAPANIPVVTRASESERVPYPPVGKPVQPSIPQPETATLPNGMKLVVVNRPDLPLVTASIQTSGGSARDPQHKAGLYSLAADLMTKGTKSRSATDIANAVESLGGSIDSGADWDSSSVSMTVKSDETAPALGILADVVRNPVFAQGEIDRQRTQRIDALKVSMGDPGSLAAMVAPRAIFGQRPYGHVAGGTTPSLKGLTRADIVGAYRDAWRPQSTSLVLVGDIDLARAKGLAAKLFGDWKAAGTAPGTAERHQGFPAPRVIVVDMPDAGQAGVVVGRPAIARSSDDYYPAIVANTVLGGGFSSRLNKEVRIKRGLAYGAGSSIDARRAPGPFTAATQTKNPSAAEVVSLIRDQMAQLGKTPVEKDELDARKASLIGGFGRRVETDSGLAGTISGYLVEGVGLDELNRFIPSVDAVTARAVERAAAKILDPGQASVIVVGDAKQFVGALRKDYPKLEVIEASDLDLDQPGLKRGADR